MESIFKNIESIRRKNNVKQSIIAEQLDVTQSAYSNYINRNRDIPLSRLTQIANILNVRVIDIITYPDVYVLESDKCVACKEKDRAIKNLNDYIDLLTKKE